VWNDDTHLPVFLLAIVVEHGIASIVSCNSVILVLFGEDLLE
jgi:hypothetical protein